jgi:hypothetical protein
MSRYSTMFIFRNVVNIFRNSSGEEWSALRNIVNIFRNSSGEEWSALVNEQQAVIRCGVRR